MQRFAPLLLTLLLGLPGLTARSAPPPPFRVIAYLPDCRAQALDAARLTPAITAKLQAVKQRHSLHLWVTLGVTLGGWERSAGFQPHSFRRVQRTNTRFAPTPSFPTLKD